MKADAESSGRFLIRRKVRGVGSFVWSVEAVWLVLVLIRPDQLWGYAYLDQRSISGANELKFANVAPSIEGILRRFDEIRRCDATNR